MVLKRSRGLPVAFETRRISPRSEKRIEIEALIKMHFGRPEKKLRHVIRSTADIPPEP